MSVISVLIVVVWNPQSHLLVLILPYVQMGKKLQQLDWSLLLLGPCTHITRDREPLNICLQFSMKKDTVEVSLVTE